MAIVTALGLTLPLGRFYGSWGWYGLMAGLLVAMLIIYKVVKGRGA